MHGSRLDGFSCSGHHGAKVHDGTEILEAGGNSAPEDDEAGYTQLPTNKVVDSNQASGPAAIGRAGDERSMLGPRRMGHLIRKDGLMVGEGRKTK